MWVGDRQAIVTWMVYGVWNDRFETVCQEPTDQEIGTIMRAGVGPDALVARGPQRCGRGISCGMSFP